MITKFVGMKEFRQNISAYAIKMKKGSMRFIVLNKNKPVIEVKAIDERDFVIEQLASDIDKARDQVKKGEVVSQEQVLKQFGVW